MVAVAQDNFPDVPATYFLDRFESELREVGWHLGPQALRNSKPSREESAKGIVKTILALPGNIEKDALRLQRQIEQGKLEMDLRTLQRRTTFLSGGIVGSGLILGMRQLVDKYQVEIAKQGVAKIALLKVVADCEEPLKGLLDLYCEAIRLSSIQEAGGAPRFPDVPFKHWAESAVQELRDAGILRGYPDGLFRG